MNDLTIYDTYAGAWWDDSVKWLRTLKAMVPARMEYFERHVKDWRGKQVLDLGCAGGFMAEALAHEGADVTGIDPAQDAISAAREHAMSEGLAITYKTGRGEQIPLGEDSVDVVVCVDVLEHVDDLKATLDETARVLKPGGLLLFDTLNRNAMSSLLAVTVAERIVGLLPRGTHDASMFIRPQELKVLLSDRNFIDIEFQGFGPVGVNRKLDFVFGRVPFTTIQYLGAARLAVRS
ncbi:MAG: bifunctional 2-polyprenyl-6-hydroxyphenol methylase/3-demethylubiquinol 3-O-methyltransferase UbiG [Pseudomonadota bacterium]